MFGENLKRLRKQKGLSQEELAERLHVVRQTISKWEQGRSVPDADLLIRIAEIFEVPVSTLLGDAVEVSNGTDLVAEKLEQLNLILAERNRRSRMIWKVVGVTLISIAVLTVLGIITALIGLVAYTTVQSTTAEKTEVLVEPVEVEHPVPYELEALEEDLVFIE
ncbi:MAG: helix-turn-helix domain-containing protein [Bacillota bacterium]|jgi:putative transcriptional regulator|nr:helix-turn-helix transcriptional regulator [Bacillota bacterium]NLU54297.1 helix-turn-helix transcriptional regulator [Bacillota bacterium]HOA91266.1 helix-turn-helix transcriptional regulator [Bacillota bacterium]HOJ46759.1 helix-turn-helix transcriptional regulator [Bacillota bacterium]HOP54157.1 helix-turn-helix transcriptional regulator [Bacillota bacterium]